MNKQEFLACLRQGLAGFPPEDIEERLAFYSEMIDDRIEEGASETEAVQCVGTVDEVVAQLLAETPLTRLVREKVRPKRRMQAWEIVLLILGFPIWASLLLAAVAVLFSVYVVLWSVLIAVWAVAVAVATCCPAGAVAALAMLLQGNGVPALAMLGAGIVCGGVAIYLMIGCKAAGKGVALLTKKVTVWVKSLFVRKEAVR